MAKYLTKFTDQASWEAGDKDFPNVSLLDDGTVKYMAERPPYSGKALLTYNDGTEYEIACNTSSTLTKNEVRSGGDNFNIANAEVGVCTTVIYESFFWCSGLTSVIIPSGATSIGRDAFYNCTSLTDVIFREGSLLKTIGNSAFYECSKLTNITIPSGVTSIEERGFYNCNKLSSVTIPSGVTSIGKEAFRNVGDNINFTCLPTTPPSLGIWAFNNSSFPIYVPAASVEAYKSAPNWNNYASRIQAIQ